MEKFVMVAMLLGLIAAAAGTTCYDCTTVVGEACGDEWVANSDYELDCSGTGDSSDEDGSCYKDKNKTKLFGVWVTTVTRGCSANGNDNTQCAQTDRESVNIFGIKSETWKCSCDGDKCNSGSQLALSSALVLSALAKFAL